ncbi:MAG: hypothetical protein ACPL3C_02185 [Pyrobaculum sp.]
MRELLKNVAMNLTLEAISSAVVLAIGVFLAQRIHHDYKLVTIFKNYPLPQPVKSNSIIDLDKLYIFIQNFKYKVEPKGVQLNVEGNLIKILSGVGEVDIVLEAWGYLDMYRVRRVIKVVE